MAFVDMMGSRRPTPGTRLALPHPRLLRRGLMQEIICCGCHCPMCDQSWHNGSAGMVREQPLCSKIGRERRPKIRRRLLLLSRSVNYFFALGKEAGKGSCGRGIQASLLWTTGRLSDSKRPRIKKKKKEKKEKKRKKIDHCYTGCTSILKNLCYLLRVLLGEVFLCLEGSHATRAYFKGQSMI